MTETYVKLEPETESETEMKPETAPKASHKPLVCGGTECPGKHRGRCKAKNSPWRKVKSEGSES